MSAPFSRSLRSLSADDGRAASAGLFVALSLLALWGAWLGGARVPVYEQSAAARVEAVGAAFNVESAVAGRVAESALVLGARVREGDALLVVDDSEQALQRREAEARLGAVGPQLEALRAQRAAFGATLREGTGAGGAAVDAARARLVEAGALARQAEEEARRAERLQRLGHGAAADLERARAQAESRAAAVAALRGELRRAALETALQGSTRRAEVARIDAEIARLEGERAALTASLARLSNLRQRYVVRAPTTGRLGAVADLHRGAVVSEGQRLATVVPDGALRLVAEFASSAAVGRVRAGQVARARFEGFPWAQFGVAPARVGSVGSEAREGRVRVELALVTPLNPRITLEHGMPGLVEVEVERVAPATLILRAAGRAVSAGREGTR